MNNDLQTLKVRAALQSMAYREVRPGIHMKPLGFMCLTYSEDRGLWQTWFKPANSDKPQVWEQHAFKPDYDYLVQLKEFEAYSRLDVHPDRMSEFELTASLSSK